MNYYNEWDKYAAQWLRNLIAAGHLPPGHVDERSIADVQPADLVGYAQCHFFAGIGGWPYALALAGWGADRPVWTGSCPCQPFSNAGKRRGTDDERHLWPEFHRLIRECRPATVLGEQVASATGWLEQVFNDLEVAGYACGAAVIPAAAVGAPHVRDRLWFVADAQWGERREESHRGPAGRVGRRPQSVPWDRPVSVALAEFRAMDDGIPRVVAATDAVRNAIVPQVAAAFVSAYMTARQGNHA